MREIGGRSIASGWRPVKSGHPGRGSTVLEPRLALLHEGGHAFFLVLGREEGVEQPPLEVHALGQRRLERTIDGLLRHQHGGPRHLSEWGCSAGTTRETRPLRSASAAAIMRPVSTMSMAFALPTKRVRRCVPPEPGMTPSVISGWPNLAVSAAMTVSHIMATSQPPPSAKPATAATIGLRQVLIRSQPSVMKSLR